MKNKKIFIIIIIIAIIGFGSILIKNNNKELENLDWLTYENTEYRYKFEYPSNAKIIDGKNYPSAFRDKKLTVIILPEKYESLKNPQYIDKDEIQIRFVGPSDEFGSTTNEIINKFSGKTRLLKQTVTEQGNIVLVYSLGQVYIIDKDFVYSIHLLSQDPSVFTQDWLSEDQIIKLKDNYANEIRILENIYSSFEIIY